MRPAPALGRLRDEVRDYVRGLPLRRGTTPLALAPDYEDWLVEAMRHGGNDLFWRDMGASVVDHLPDYKDVPVYHVGGWYDSWAAQTANLNYLELRRTKKSLQRLIMGPWTHGGQERTFAGTAEFGKDAAIDLGAFHRRWFDRWLKGAANGVDTEAPVRLFVMGGGDGHKTPEGRLFVGGHWRDEGEWPLARAKATPYYLHADGRLSPDLPKDAPPTRYLFDPKRPVPTIGGNLSSENGLMARGALDQVCAPGDPGLRRPPAPRRAQRRARVRDPAPGGGHGGHGPPGGQAVDHVVTPGHRLHGQARGRVALEPRLPRRGRRSTWATPSCARAFARASTARPSPSCPAAPTR